jgi:hypothetical protein
MADEAVEIPSGALTWRGNKRINYALAATLLAAGVTLADAAKQVGAASGDVLRVGLKRRGVSAKQARSVPKQGERIISETLKIATDAAGLLRDKLGEHLGQAVEALADKPIRYSDLPNEKQGHAAVLKTLAETHRTLYGGAESINVVFGVNVIHDAGDPAPIEVQAEVLKPSEPEG